MTKQTAVKIIECPRDAMQGIHQFIPTEKKIEYINQLLKVGFDTLDFGSFVSPKAVPQMADTALVLSGINLSETKTKLSAIVINKRGAIDACFFESIKYLGFPFSVSETFQQRNANSTIEESIERVEQIQELCKKYNKELHLYLSMGFGNPYGDPWNIDEIGKWVEKLSKLEIKIFSLSDTIGVSNPENISYIFQQLNKEYPNLEFGAHLHTTPSTWLEKIEAAYKAGCTRFDGAIKGFGGCPMAKDELVGNMPTENLIEYFKNKNAILNLNETQFSKAFQLTTDVFPLT